MSMLSTPKKVAAGLFAGVAALAFVAAPAISSSQQTQAPQRPLAQIGQPAPNFELPDLDGKKHSLEKLREGGYVVVLEWFNADCPFVVKHHQHHQTMKETYKEFKDKKVRWVAINSAAPGGQGHGIERNKRAHREWEMQYPILIDEPGTVGRAYGARTTPHMYIISAEGVLIYNGAIDNNRSARELGDINYVQKALKEHFNGDTVEIPETRPYGCSVKYEGVR